MGTAPNLPFYAASPPDSIVGLEPNPAMKPYAMAEAERLGLGSRMEYLSAGAEGIPLEDASVDAVVVTLVR